MSETKKRTPSLILKAIEEGAKKTPGGAALSTFDLLAIELHLQDALAQKFGVALLRASGNVDLELAIKELYIVITGER
jgi:hypothetical protein